MIDFTASKWLWRDNELRKLEREWAFRGLEAHRQLKDEFSRASLFSTAPKTLADMIAESQYRQQRERELDDMLWTGRQWAIDNLKKHWQLEDFIESIAPT